MEFLGEPAVEYKQGVEGFARHGKNSVSRYQPSSYISDKAFGKRCVITDLFRIRDIGLVGITGLHGEIGEIADIIRGETGIETSAFLQQEFDRMRPRRFAPFSEACCA